MDKGNGIPPNHEWVSFRKLCRALREMQQLTLNALQSRMYVSRGFMEDFESGNCNQKEMSSDIFERIRKCLELSSADDQLFCEAFSSTSNGTYISRDHPAFKFLKPGSNGNGKKPPSVPAARQESCKVMCVGGPLPWEHSAPKPEPLAHPDKPQEITCGPEFKQEEPRKEAEKKDSGQKKEEEDPMPKIRIDEESMASYKEMNFPELLKDLRAQKGLSQTILAERAGLSNGFISPLENSRAFCSPKAAQNLAKALGITLELREVFLEKAAERPLEVVPAEEPETEKLDLPEDGGEDTKPATETTPLPAEPADTNVLEASPPGVSRFSPIDALLTAYAATRNLYLNEVLERSGITTEIIQENEWGDKILAGGEIWADIMNLLRMVKTLRLGPGKIRILAGVYGLCAKGPWTIKVEGEGADFLIWALEAFRNFPEKPTPEGEAA